MHSYFESQKQAFEEGRRQAQMKRASEPQAEFMATALAQAIIFGIGVPIRVLIVALSLGYAVPFWLAFTGKPPTDWNWWYGALIGTTPIYGGFVVRLSFFAAVATFIASFFV